MKTERVNITLSKSEFEVFMSDLRSGLEFAQNINDEYITKRLISIIDKIEKYAWISGEDTVLIGFYPKEAAWLFDYYIATKLSHDENTQNAEYNKIKYRMQYDFQMKEYNRIRLFADEEPQGLTQHIIKEKFKRLFQYAGQEIAYSSLTSYEVNSEKQTEGEFWFENEKGKYSYGIKQNDNSWILTKINKKDGSKKIFSVVPKLPDNLPSY